MHPAASAADKTGFFLLTAAGVLAPIPNGSTTASVAGLIGVALAVCLLCAPHAPPPGARSSALCTKVLLLSGFLLAWSVVQALLPITSAAPLGPPPAAGDLGVNVDAAKIHLQPLQSVGYVLLPFATFMAALLFIRDDARYLTFLHILLATGFVVTTVALAEFIVSPRTLLLQPKLHYLGSFTGTFVNPNTAATYFGTMLLLSLSLCLRQFAEIRRHQRMIRRTPTNPRMRIFLVYCGWTLVFTVALLLTRSRGGNLSSTIAIAVFIGAYAFFAARKRGATVRLRSVGALAAVGTVIVLFAILAQRVMLRIQTEGLFEKGRLCTYQSTWQAIQDHFWLGTGLGSFQDVFPAYRNPECGMSGYWEMAHSVYLEGWLSLGAPFLLLLVVVYYQLIKTYAYGYRHRHRFNFVPLTALAILLLLSLHSLVDFSLQIPGMAVFAALVLGAAAAVSLAPRGADETRSDRTDG